MRTLSERLPPAPRILSPWPTQRLDGRTRGSSPVHQQSTVGSVWGAAGNVGPYHDRIVDRSDVWPSRSDGTNPLARTRPPHPGRVRDSNSKVTTAPTWMIMIAHRKRSDADLLRRIKLAMAQMQKTANPTVRRGGIAFVLSDSAASQTIIGAESHNPPSSNTPTLDPPEFGVEGCTGYCTFTGWPGTGSGGSGQGRFGFNSHCCRCFSSRRICSTRAHFPASPGSPLPSN